MPYTSRTYGLAYGVSPRRGFYRDFKHRTLDEVVRKRWEEDTNVLFKILSGIAIGQHALAGMAYEMKARGDERTPRSLWQAALQGVEKQQSFRTITPNDIKGKAMGFTMDMVIDPANLLAVGPVAKVWGKGVRGVANVTGKSLQMIPPINVLAKKTGEKFIPYYALKNLGLGDAIDHSRVALGELASVQAVELTETGRAITKLVPDVSRREELIKLRELRPPKGSRKKGAAAQEKEYLYRYNALTKNEKQAMELLASKVRELEEVKEGAGLLERAAMSGLETKMQQRYWSPHFWKRFKRGRQDITPEGAMEHIMLQKTSRRNIALTDKEIAKASETLKAADDWAEPIRDSARWSKLTPSQRAAIPNKITQPDDIMHINRRRIVRRISDMDERLAEELELDAAKLIDIAERDVAKAVIFQEYMRSMTQFLRSRSMMIPDEVAKLPKSQWKSAAKALGVDLPDEALSAKWVKLRASNLDEGLSNLWVPSAVHDELEAVMRNYKEPGEFASLFRRVTGWYKAWTLSIFPAYHSRNVISNLWNNYLAGMVGGPQSEQAYQRGISFMFRDAIGDLSEAPVQVGKHLFKNERELKSIMMRHRIIDAGQFSEIDDVIGGVSSPRKVMNLVHPDPARNSFVRAGFKTGRFFEDHARASHFFWRLQRGDSINDAVRSVNKYLFDYHYGLSPFERKYLRDRWMPFYSWTRFNIPLQLEMLIAQPHKYGNAYKVIDGAQDYLGGPEPDEIFMADFIKKNASVRINWDQKSGQYTYFMLDGWWPAADIKKLGPDAIFEIANLVNPIIKSPAEAFLANYSMFRRRKIEDFPGQKKDVTFGVPFVRQLQKDVPIDARWEHVIRSVRLINEIDRVIESMRDQYGGGEKRAFFIRTFLGKAYPQNYAAQKRWWDISTQKSLSELKRIEKRATAEGDWHNVRALKILIRKVERERREHLGI